MQSAQFIYQYLYFTLFLLGSCKTMTPVQLAAPIQPPASFTGSTDTTSIGAMSWKEFFSDQHLKNLIDKALRHNMDLQMAIQ